MKIITYNVNGLRSALSKGFTDWLAIEKPDVVCLQETKAQPDQIPTLEFEALGYKAYFFSARKKGYSGVGILTKITPDHVEYGIGISKYDDEGRFIRADYGDISIASVYHPSGTTGDEWQAFKMEWLEDFRLYVNNLRQKHEKLIICGDYNICHRPIDIHDPVRNANSSGFLPEEREWMSRFLDDGYTDTFRFFHPEEPHHYTWWSFRANARANNKGWRIDYCMATQAAVPLLKDAYILPQVKHSDHCPAVVELNV